MKLTPIRNQRELELANGTRPWGAQPTLRGCAPPFTSGSNQGVRLTGSVEPQGKSQKKPLKKKK